MQKIYRCPICTKANYDYGLCSKKCEEEFKEKLEEENKTNPLYRLFKDIKESN